MTYKDKLLKQHLGKSKAFGKIKKQGKIEAHFELYHYAGTVQYNVIDWLLKNKDPLNGSVVALYKASSIPVVQTLWESYVSADDAAAKGKGGKGGKRQKGGSFQTVSGLHKESLNRLMTNLKATQPHFIRCIIPNEIKKPGYMEWNLVLHQLRCNGVLEGIRICRKGFPSRVIYDEWRQRYTLLNANAIPKGTFIDAKKACEKIIVGIPELVPDNYRFGHTKLFFKVSLIFRRIQLRYKSSFSRNYFSVNRLSRRIEFFGQSVSAILFKAGMIGMLEDLRDDKINNILTMLQTKMRCNMSRPKFLQIRRERDAALIVQNNWRKYQVLKHWPWQGLMFKLKPLLKTEEKLKEMQEMKDNMENLKKELEDEKGEFRSFRKTVFHKRCMISIELCYQFLLNNIFSNQNEV